MLCFANGDRTFTWDKVRQLSSVSDTDLQVDYTYDDSGIRTSKTVNGVTTHYNTKDGVILAQSDGNNTLYFQYDTSGVPFAFVWNDAQYFYVTNQMGDVMGITDDSGNLLVQYHYDAWGKLLSTTLTDANNATQKQLAALNPLLYRGYYYDFETGYYYLQSRYYDPNLCRFINADMPDSVLGGKNEPIGSNLFTYCLNAPMNNIDSDGHITINLKNKKTNNVIVKFARKLASNWTLKTSASIQSKKKLKYSKWGITIYIGASVSGSLSALKNNVSSSKSSVKVSDKCSLSFGKRKLTLTRTITYKNNTVKGTMSLGSNSLAYGVSIITKFYYTSRTAYYFSIDFGYSIKHSTTLAATAMAAALCVAVPYIAPTIAKAYISILSAMASSRAFVASLSVLASVGLTVAKKFA